MTEQEKVVPKGGCEILLKNLYKYVDVPSYNTKIIMSACSSFILDSSQKNVVWQHLNTNEPLVVGMGDNQGSQNIIAEIKNIRQGNFDLSPENNNSSVSGDNYASVIKKAPKVSSIPTSTTPTIIDHSVKGEWTDLVTNQEKQKSQGLEVENSSLARKK